MIRRNSSRNDCQGSFVSEEGEIQVEIPPQLHPAVSNGMRRISSSVFSIEGSDHHSSIAEMVSFLESSNSSKQEMSTWGVDFLYDDLLMQILGFLDLDSLSSFSQTARRTNIECFHFIQLSLQQSLLGPCPTGLPRTEVVTKLAAEDYFQASELVQDYNVASNTTMPLSHSMAYMRQLFRQKHPPMAAASAALFLVAAGTAASIGLQEAEVPGMIFRMGVLGSLMGAANTANKGNVRRRAEAFAHQLQDYSRAIMEQARPYTMKHMLEVARSVTMTTVKQQSTQIATEDTSPKEESQRVPTGCVGIYRRTIQQAHKELNERIRQRRLKKYHENSDEERQRMAEDILVACHSDENLDTVRDYLVDRESYDVDSFHTGAEGAETCALHTAAFNGCTAILDFLCNQEDGGLSNVNLQDENGWTALHFAAGANSVDACRALIKHGANPNKEALNGYTPLQWAVRLQNHAVADELRKQTQTTKPFAELATRLLSMIPSH